MQEKLAALRSRLQILGQRLGAVGFEGTRRAVASLVFAFFGTIYLLVALSSPPGWGRAFVGLAACYLVGSLAVAAEWFWGRWYVMGLGWSQAVVAIIVMYLNGWHPIFAIYGGLHVLTVVLLAGKTMMVRYEMQEGWRQRWAMDEYGVARLRKTVTRASASLPSLILWALAPREGDGEALVWGVAGTGLVLLVLVGLSAVIRLRTWGILALAAAGLMLPWLAPSERLPATLLAGAMPTTWTSWFPALPSLLLLTAIIPFLLPLISWLKPARR